MKKELLLFISASLFSFTVCAQRPHSTISKSKSRIELVKKQREAKQEAANVQRKKLENKVNNAITSYKLENMRKAVETVSVNLLDEMVIEGQERRTYTYSPDGKRDEERVYYWANGTWQWDENSSLKYDYQYDAQNRCIKRSIYLGGMEISKLEITYKDGNCYYKYYEPTDENGDGRFELSLAYENGYDAQKREILNKRYRDGNLEYWTEQEYNEYGDIIYDLYWSGWSEGSNGNKKETVTEGLKRTESYYNWEHSTQAWIYTNKTITETNQAGRKLSEENIIYTEDGNPEEKTKETYTYDSYGRITSWTYERAEDGSTYANEEKEEYTYWGNEYYGPDGDNMGFEGPLLTYASYQWEGNKWVVNEQATITRDENGKPITALIDEYDDERINDQYIDIIRKSEGTFDNQGNITYVETIVYRRDNNEKLYTEKEELQYDTQNRRILSKYFRQSGAEWILTDEEGTEYDNQGREVMVWYRYIMEHNGEWSGEKRLLVYNGNITETTGYRVNPKSGEFMTTPSYFYAHGILPNGCYQDSNIEYDESGNVAYAYREEYKEENIDIRIPTPEAYNDGIDMGSVPSQIGVNYRASYQWINGNWILMRESGCYYEGSNIVLIEQYEGHIMYKEIFSFDSENRLIAHRSYDRGEELNGETTYEYNTDGLLSKKNENGRITTYKYSEHQVTGLEKNAVSLFKVNGRTITTDNNETILQVYSIAGTLVANGTGTITLPESGIYIVVADTVRQKIVIR
ncbi:hypothetical protein [Bacteroides sp.]